MEKVILIGGEAGQGVARTSFLISKTLINMGYYVFNYRDYPSLIRGGHNFNVLKISDKPIHSHENSYDIIIALDQKTIDKHGKKLKKDGLILTGKNLRAKHIIEVDVDSVIKKIGAPKIFGNNILIGSLFKLLALPIQPCLKTFEKEFKKKIGLIKKSIKEGYNAVEKRQEMSKPKKGKRYFLTGNEAIASGAIASGLDIYIAYPITPATPVLHFLASKQLENKFLVIQPENEIAVIISALGASYAGAMTMVGTSGAGFSLMSEGLSLQGISEIPLVVYLGQRTGPATGVPTYTSQGDLKFALNVGHGEFPRVVVAPGDAREAFYRTIESFYLAYKYRILAILLGDKHLGESNYTFDKFKKPLVKPSRFIIKKPESRYKSYLMTKNGVSPRAVPGQSPVVRASSYEHNDYGYTIDDPEWTVEMNDKRFRKVKYLKQEINKLSPVSVYGKGKNLVIGWGSTKGAILDAMKKLKDFRFLQISYIKPFPDKKVKKEIEKSRKVILVENNVTGLLGDVITEQTGHFIDKKILKYDARPFTSSSLVNKIKKVVK